MAKHVYGGAWKVAYADFVTAMMALFLVLWLTAQDAKIKEAVERAFRNPFSSVTKESVGIIPNESAQATHPSEGRFESPTPAEMELLRRLTEDLAKLFAQNEESTQDVKIELTPEGLRVNVFDKSSRPVFEPDSVQFTEYGSWVFQALAWEIARFRTFRVELEGHTEAGRPLSRDDYGEWELSADRANAARRHLVKFGAGSEQIGKVTGLASTQPMPGTEAKSEVNRRITVLVRLNSEGNN
ncbi:MAG: flagellar motor protein MotB [Limisphaerales bacterium]